MNFNNPVSETDSITMIHWAIDKGINFIDTADVYEGYDRFLGSPGGKAEAIIGKALARRRSDVLITTKVGNHVADSSYDGKGLGTEHITRQIEASLRRMKTDYVDIYELHFPDPNTPVEETISVIDALIDAGKVRYWGFSNHTAEQINTILTTCRKNSWPLPVISQPLYNWLLRDIEENDIPLCINNNISITPYRPLEKGLLTGKYSQGQEPPASSRAAENPVWLNLSDVSTDTFTLLKQFEEEAKTQSLSPANYAVKWLLDRPGVSSVIIGGKTLEQLNQFL
jgi:aryl-alcohol dehydrogenase-like predicted oxidoreductase